jgi:hypothetical protein
MRDRAAKSGLGESLTAPARWVLLLASVGLTLGLAPLVPETTQLMAWVVGCLCVLPLVWLDQWLRKQPDEGSDGVRLGLLSLGTVYFLSTGITLGLSLVVLFYREGSWF